ncbi:MAG: SpaH/EbpB family LPXTG-anchored major pilin [Propionibacterium sp.]|nr:SpaH/EbpB family LPXTG-anchored major pilin [Propionibacterium sp.]
MTGRVSLLKRLVAGAGALALATVGMVATTAHADDNVDPNKTGTLTVQKYEEDTDPVMSNPLEGVEFTVCEVLLDGESVDLTTDAAWEAFAEWTPDKLPADAEVSTDCESTRTNVDGGAVFEDMSVGVYLVTETDSGDNLIATPADPFLVAIPMPEGEDGNWSFNYDVVAKPKNTLNELETEKKAIAPEDVIWEVGAEVQWTITTTIPASGLDYKSLVLTDDVSSGLEFVSWDSITLDDVTLDAGIDYTVADNVVTFTAAGLAKVNEGPKEAQKLVATVTTEVLEFGEVLEVGVHKNTATIKLNGTPASDDSTTNWGSIGLVKKSSVGDALLAGAEFELHMAVDGQCVEGDPIATGTTDANGEVSWNFFIGNDEAKTARVCLKETKAPAGHVLPANPWFGPQTVTAGDTASYAYGEIVNHKPGGPTLPSTGAEGTRALVLGGFGLVIVAGVALAARRRLTATR